MKSINTVLMLFVLLVIIWTASGSTCTYYRAANKLSCNGITCTTESLVWGGKLPRGLYRIGTFYYHGSQQTPWFNLYRYKGNGNYWDYHTKIPTESCRGGFGLHPGTVSEGCITVLNDSCFNRIKNAINLYSPHSFSAIECRKCFWGKCRGGTSTVSRSYTTTLSST